MIISRKDALMAGKKHYFTGKECGRGHISKRWVKNHRCVECNVTDRQNRRDIEKIRTPDWACDVLKAEIRGIYSKCSDLNKEHGERSFHVDHEIPLRGKTVSGLHVPWNLSITEAAPNLKKGNLHDPKGCTTRL